jgi:DNA gyrase subunit A
VRRTDGGREVLIATENGQAVRFEEDKVRQMGRVSTGVRGVTLGEGDAVASMAIAEEGVEILTVTTNGFGKRTPVEDYRKTNRGGKGVRTIVVNERNGKVHAIRTVTGEESLLIVTKDGMVVRSPVHQVSKQGRSTQGVTIMRMNKGDEVVQVAVLREAPDADDAEVLENSEEE